MAVTSCTKIALLVFASVAILGVLVNAEVCEDNIGSCQGIDCQAVCGTKHIGSKGTCDQSNNCMCHFDCPLKGKCNDGLGRCTAACGNDCCASNCAKKHAGGVGFCDDSLGHSSALCQCQYPC